MPRSQRFSNSSAPIACGAFGAIADKLAEMGKPVDREALLAPRPGGGRSAGRWSPRRSSKLGMSRMCARRSIS